MTYVQMNDRINVALSSNIFAALALRPIYHNPPAGLARDEFWVISYYILIQNNVLREE